MSRDDDWTPPAFRTVALLFTAFLVLQAFDAATTLWSIRLGIAEEANPLMRALLARGTAAFLAVKLCLTGGGFVLLLIMGRRWPQVGRLAWLAAVGVTIFYAAFALRTAYHLGRYLSG